MKNSCGGFYYEINRDHPIIKQIIAFDNNLEKPLCSLLKQIERCLPLNQLYVDMNNDEQLQNELPQDSVDIAKTLRTMIELGRTLQEKIAFLNTMSKIEPFSTYPTVVEEVRKELES